MRGEPQAREGPRDWLDCHQRARRDHWRCQELREWETTRRLAWPGIQTILQRRQDNSTRNQQARRYVLANSAHPRRTFRGQSFPGKARSEWQSLAAVTTGTTERQLLGRCSGQQERACRLGVACPRLRLRIWVHGHSACSRIAIQQAIDTHRRRQPTAKDYTPQIAQATRKLMARQVRPWPAEPENFKALRVRSLDRGAGQRIPSGTKNRTLWPQPTPLSFSRSLVRPLLGNPRGFAPLMSRRKCVDPYSSGGWLRHSRPSEPEPEMLHYSGSF